MPASKYFIYKQKKNSTKNYVKWSSFLNDIEQIEEVINKW